MCEAPIPDPTTPTFSLTAAPRRSGTAIRCASSASSMARKQCACPIAVSVRFSTSSRSRAPVVELHARAVHVPRPLPVGQEQMVPPGRPSVSMYFLSSMFPPVPIRNSRPSPQTGDPSTVIQSTRMNPVACSDATTACP